MSTSARLASVSSALLLLTLVTTAAPAQTEAPDEGGSASTSAESDENSDQPSGAATDDSETDAASEAEAPAAAGPTSSTEEASRAATTDSESPSDTARGETSTEEDEMESEEDENEEDDEEVEAEQSVVASDLEEPSIYVASNAEDDDTQDWRIGIGGYLRTKFRHIEDDPDVSFVGRNDGFILGDARLSLHGSMKNGLGFMFEFDGSVGESDDADVNSPIVDVRMRLKDTFAYYKPIDQLRVSLGQFKPPYDVEELTSNAELLFVDESVASRGVQNVEGYNVDGLSLTREVGLRLDGEPYYFLSDDGEAQGPGASYALAVTNGQDANRNLNDNDRLAYYGRGALHWGEYVRLGGAYFYNEEQAGELPDPVDIETRGWTADLTFTGFGVTAIGSIMQQTEAPFQGTAADEAERTARGYQAQIAYEEPFLGLQPAYRYAYYDPSADYGEDSGDAESIFDRDARTHHTVGLNYNAHGYPVRVMVDYTFTQEQEGRELQNNRLDALVQLSW